jgi:RNA recognition motif-containing protein
VTFKNDEDAQKAISEMNEKEVEGRALKVTEARPMEPRN